MSTNLNMYFLYMYFLYQGHHDDREAFAVVVEASFKSKRNPSGTQKAFGHIPPGPEFLFQFLHLYGVLVSCGPLLDGITNLQGTKLDMVHLPTINWQESDLLTTLARWLSVIANFMPALGGSLKLQPLLTKHGSAMALVISKNSGVILVYLLKIWCQVCTIWQCDCARQLSLPSTGSMA